MNTTYATRQAQETVQAKKQSSKNDYLPPANRNELFFNNSLIQRKAGCACGGGCPACRSENSNLPISQPNDASEIEADAMADKVMRMAINSSSAKNAVSRKNAKRKEAQKENSNESTSFAPPIVRDVLSSGGKALDAGTRTFMESRFNYDFGSVKIHDNEPAAKSADSINALAYTLGDNIVFNSGQYNTNSDSGRHLLAHELAHVVQQRNGLQKKIMRESRRVGPNQVDVDRPGGGVCHVTRVFEPRSGPSERATSPTVSADADAQNITLSIRWCRGQNRGDITLGANVPAQARDAAQRILDALNSGRGATGVEEELRDTDVQPFLDVVIAQSGQFSISAHGEITVGVGGVTAGSGELTLRRGPFDVGIRGGGDEQGWNVGVTGRVTPGQGNETFRCPTIPIPLRSHLECECPTPARTRTEYRDTPFPNRQTRFVYFNYAVAQINRSLSDERITEIENLLRQGYRVTAISGFTSPEGPIAPGRRFEGNRLLAEERAAAALTELQALCSRIALSMRNPGQCVSGALTAVVPIGQGELYGSRDGTELRGRDLEEFAVEQFQANDRETAHRDERLEESLRDRTTAQQAATIYPLLRRVEISLERNEMRRTPVRITDPAGMARVPCPADVATEARIQFLF